MNELGRGRKAKGSSISKAKREILLSQAPTLTSFRSAHRTWETGLSTQLED